MILSDVPLPQNAPPAFWILKRLRYCLAVLWYEKCVRVSSIRNPVTPSDFNGATPWKQNEYACLSAASPSVPRAIVGSGVCIHYSDVPVSLSSRTIGYRSDALDLTSRLVRLTKQRLANRTNKSPRYVQCCVWFCDFCCQCLTICDSILCYSDS